MEKDYRRIESYEDACKALGLKPISDEVFNAFGEDAKTMAAYHKLSVITRAINEGWQPDWHNRDERKYEPYYYTNSDGLACAHTSAAPSYTATDLGSRLCFKDYERAAFAVKTFGETLYKDYFRPYNYGEVKDGAAEEDRYDEESENGGKTISKEADLTGAPEFIKNVVGAVKKHIQPLCEGSRKRGVIVIAVEDGIKNGRGDKGHATQLAIIGEVDNLAKGLKDFLQNDDTEPIVKRAYQLRKIDSIIEDIEDFIKGFGK